MSLVNIKWRERRLALPTSRPFWSVRTLWVASGLSFDAASGSWLGEAALMHSNVLGRGIRVRGSIKGAITRWGGAARSTKLEISDETLKDPE